jgi:Na+-transporting methylmalonyl-CoA/oxaloacetate decarboxylase gamma subunit
MTENLWITAQISLLGMGLVFGAILLLWGVLALLVYLTTEHPPQEETTQTEPANEAVAAPAIPSRDARARAAAAAVAIALALNTPPPASDSETPGRLPTNVVSAWQAVTRATALNARRPRR